MKILDEHKIQLKSGTILDGFRNIIGIGFNDGDNSIYYGKDGEFDYEHYDDFDGIYSLSKEDRKEIAEFMIERWTKYLNSI